MFANLQIESYVYLEKLQVNFYKFMFTRRELLLQIGRYVYK